MDTIEYRVRPVTRYVVTRYQSVDSCGSVETRGEFDNEQSAYDVAYALCKTDHERIGWPVGDDRVKYPPPLRTPTPQETIDRIHRHELASGPGIMSAEITDGPLKGYTIGEAMVLEQLKIAPTAA